MPWQDPPGRRTRERERLTRTIATTLPKTRTSPPLGPRRAADLVPTESWGRCFDGVFAGRIRTSYVLTIRSVADVCSPGGCHGVRTMRKRPVTIDLQPWPYPERPRVLIEHHQPDAALELATAIRQAGCTVGICRGPDATADPATRCPLHRLEPCIAVEGADLVVTALDLEEEEGRQVLRGLRTRYPSTPPGRRCDGRRDARPRRAAGGMHGRLRGRRARTGRRGSPRCAPERQPRPR